MTTEDPKDEVHIHDLQPDELTEEEASQVAGGMAPASKKQSSSSGGGSGGSVEFSTKMPAPPAPFVPEPMPSPEQIKSLF